MEDSKRQRQMENNQKFKEKEEEEEEGAALCKDWTSNKFGQRKEMELFRINNVAPYQWGKAEANRMDVSLTNPIKSSAARAHSHTVHTVHIEGVHSQNFQTSEHT